MTETEIRNQKIAELEELQELQGMLRGARLEFLSAFQKCEAVLGRVGIKKAQEAYGRLDGDRE